MEITFNGKRNLKKFDDDEDITQYYKDLAALWNEFDSYQKMPIEKRGTGYRSAYDNFFYKLLYLWDLIVQTEHERLEEIQKLKNELNRWTANQNGRKPTLTEEQKEDIRADKRLGESNRALARTYIVSEGTIRNVLKEKK